MKRPQFLTLLLVLFSLACDKAAPTEQSSRVPTPSDRLELTGTWTGTISWARSPRDPFPQGEICSSEQVRADLAQTGTSVSLRIATRCKGMLNLNLSLEGSSLVGDGGLVVGTASATRISMNVSASPSQAEGFVPRYSIVLNR